MPVHNGLLVGLSRQDTLPASDPIWTKPPSVPGLSTPIPPRNEPSISSYYIMPIEDKIDSDSITPRSTPRSLPQTLQPAEVDIQIMLDVPTSVTSELGLQVGIFCIFNLHSIPTYVLHSCHWQWLDCLVRIHFPLAILFGRSHHLSLACQLQSRLAMSHRYLPTPCS